MKKQIGLFKSYKYFAIFATICYVVIMGIVLHAFYYSNKIESENIGQRSIFEVEQVINPIFRENESLIYFLSEYIDSMLLQGAGAKEIESYLSVLAENYRREVDANFLGAFGMIDGEYINSEPFEPDDGFVPEDRLWYKAAMAAGGGIGVTNPYTDLQTGEKVLSFSKSISENRGVIGIDIWLKDVISVTNKLSTKGIEAIYIMDTDGNIIFHSMEEFLGLNFKNGGSNSEELELAQNIDDNPGNSFEMNLRGHRCKVFNSPLNNGWTAVVIIDLIKEFLAGGWYIFLYTMLITAGFIVILYSTYHYDKRRRSSENLTAQLLAASAIYRTMSLLDIENDMVQNLNAGEDILEVFGSSAKGIQTSMDEAIRHFVSEESCEQMLEFINLSTLDERMEGKNTITVEFLENIAGWCRARFIVVEYDETGRLKKVLYAVESIDEEKRRENQLRYLSEMDGLTGINNRAAGEHMIRSLMVEEREGLFCLMDVDKFKSINDTFGHSIGDEVLVDIANSLKESFRESDVVMRLGGDEFAVFVVNTTGNEAADNVISRLFESIDAIDIPEMNGTKIHISLGAAFFKNGSLVTFEELYEKADKGLYISKKTPGNHYTLID